MKPLRLLPLFLFFVMALSGCQESSGPPEAPAPFVPEPIPVEVDGCLKVVCRAESTHSDAVYMRETYGVEQITADGPREMGPRIEGDLVVWQVGARINGTVLSHLFAYNLSTEELIAIGWEDYYRQTLFEVSQGRVVFAQLPILNAPDPGHGYMVLWSEATRERTRIHTGLVGEAQPFGYDHPWIVFRNRFSPTPEENGLFAHNAETNQTIHIYTVRDPDESGEALGGETVADGFVYYEVHGVEVGELDSWLFEYDLQNRSQRVVWTHYGNHAIGMSGNDRYVAWESFGPAGGPHLVRAYDRVTENVTEVISLYDGHGIHVQAGGDWVTYLRGFHGYPDDSWLAARHMPTGEEITILARDRDVWPEYVATDGNRTVFVVLRMRSMTFEETGDDLYWQKLPEIRPPE